MAHAAADIIKVKHLFTFFNIAWENNWCHGLLWRTDVPDQVEGERRGGPSRRQAGKR